MVIWKLALLAAWLFIAACSSQPEQVSFALRLAEGRENSLQKIVSAAARRLQMRITSETFDFGGPGGTMRTYMLSGGGIQVIIRGSSVEECEVREGRREPEFSPTLHNVSVIKTTTLANSTDMAEVVAAIREAAHHAGATVVPDAAKCNTR